MSANAIARARLAHQHIERRERSTPGELVAALGAVQAQDYPGAKWSLGLRLDGATDADVERAIAERAIVRTWPMRGTLHFVAAEDARWMLALLSPRVLKAAARRHRELALDEATFAKAGELWAEALAGGAQRTREEMYELLERAGISTAEQRGYHMLWRLAQEGVLCFGPPRGKQQTFVLLDEWVPTARPKAREEALAEVARRYFLTRGPATVQDFLWWTGLAAADAKAALSMVEGELERVVVEGQTYWSGRGGEARAEGATRAHLLPGFDEFLLAYRDRSAALEERYAKRLHAGGGAFSPSVAVDGRICGTWRRTIKRHSVTVEVTPFARWTKAEREAIAAAAERYGAFLGMPAQMVVSAGA